MSLISNFEAEVKAFVIKVLEDLDLYHPPTVTAAPAPPDVTPPPTGEPIHTVPGEPNPSPPTTPPNAGWPNPHGSSGAHQRLRTRLMTGRYEDSDELTIPQERLVRDVASITAQQHVTSALRRVWYGLLGMIVTLVSQSIYIAYQTGIHLDRQDNNLLQIQALNTRGPTTDQCAHHRRVPGIRHQRHAGADSDTVGAYREQSR